ncbi:tRNA pseudouridine(55) synthase TruB [Frigoribacterium sp. VKM Ac-2530]|uniref:tRNA pseudouridine(55) synthase TruB n=1 Tax=Frigoribacterium sp. VKM Ac-2530 TaxID=2783822 RepID=UPI00188BE74C|nr:tRNA pseudouridine(55) synthase TruB [Frigoribacterium sp. VKM Ac-2530]
MNSGILLVDKPQGITSHDVVARVRKAAGTRKVGHAGTLDPLATGLLVLGLDSSTRLLTFLVGLDKTYEATIRLGVSTASDDSEGEVVATADASGVSDAAVDAGIADLTGPISQVPTTVSAIKVGGRRAYDLAREGVEVELKARDVVVSEFVVLDRRDAVVDGTAVRDLDVRVSCSSGTYVRALARDLGGALGVGGHLTALRRTRVGSFDVADAAVLEGIEVAPALLAPTAVASSLFPVWSMTADEAVDLGHGKRPATGRADTEGPVAAVTASGDLAGLVSVRGGRAVTIVNFPTDEVRA